MNLALTDQFGSNRIEVSPARLQSAKSQRSQFNFPIGMQRLVWVPAAILALGILKKYVAPSTRDLGRLPEEKTTVRDDRDLLTRMREAGW